MTHKAWPVGSSLRCINLVWEDGHTLTHDILACGAKGIRHNGKRPINAEWSDKLSKVSDVGYMWSVGELKETVMFALRPGVDRVAIVKALGLDIEEKQN